MIMRRLLATAVLITALSARAENEPAVVSLSARVEPTPVRFAEPFTLVVEIVRPRGLELTLPSALPEKPAVRSAGPTRRTVTDLAADAGPTWPLVVERIEIPLLALDTEGLETPALTLVDAHGTRHEIPALEIAIAGDTHVDAGAASEPAFAAARTHHVFTVRDWRPLASLSSLASGALVAWLAGVLLRRRRVHVPARAERALVVDLPPADVLALARLDALLAEGLLARGEVAPFVERLMDEILRAYLEARFALPASRRTTRELAAELLGLATPGLDLALMRDILETADLVRFARAGVATESAHDMANKVRALIMATRAPRAEGP